MFKNRAIQVKMVKNDEKEETPNQTSSDQVRVRLATIRFVGISARRTIVTIGKVGVAYIAADTIRQVMVAKASK